MVRPSQRHGRVTVLDHLDRPRTIRDLADRTGHTRGQVTAIVAELLALGIIEEVNGPAYRLVAPPAHDQPPRCTEAT
jgi:hypothetical protein